MKNIHAKRGGGRTLIWDKPEPERKFALAPLTRDKIVRAALAVADAQGLDRVSLRNVAAELNAGPMRLYAYISTKDDLLDLMVDALYGELNQRGQLPSDWAEAMRVNARQLRKLTHRHPWFLPLLGGRPHQGPHALNHMESLLAVLYNSDQFADIDNVLQALKTIQAYIVGGLQRESNEIRAENKTSLSKQEWQASTADHLFQIIKSGKLPTVAKVVVDASHPPEEKVFFDGLEAVIDGVRQRFTK